MDEYVHKRDVSIILSQLQTDLDNLRKEAEENPEKEKEIKTKIDELLKNAERDLRLKTQAIVRSRLAQSNVLPLNVTLPTEKEKTDFTGNSPAKKSIATRRKTEPRVHTPKLEAKHSFSRQITPRKGKQKESSAFNYTTQSNRPLVNSRVTTRRAEAMTPLRTQNTERRAQTQTMKRRRIIPEKATHLPHVDLHDPAAPPPPLPPDAVNTYGIETLLGTGYMKQRDVHSQLQDTLVIGKYRNDLEVIPNLNVQDFIYDPIPDSSLMESDPEDEPVDVQEDEVVKESKKKDNKLVIELINGDPLHTGEYYLFKKKYQTNWEQLTIVLMIIKQFCQRNGFGRQRINGEIVYELSKIDPDDIPDTKLSACFLDPIDGKKRRSVFIGPTAEHDAAVRIQSVWRGFIARRLLRSLMRNSAAARLIQRWYRTMKIHEKFKSNFAIKKKEIISLFESTVYEQNDFKIDRTHIQVHFIDSNSAAELGRLRYLNNKYATLIFITRCNYPSDVTLFINEFTNSDVNLHIIPTHFKLPNSVSIEDIFSQDVMLQKKVAEYSQKLPLAFLPKNNCISLIESSKRLNGKVLAPSPNKIVMFKTRESIQRLLKRAGLKIFESSDYIIDLDVLSKEITTFILTFPRITTWRLRINNGETAWFCTNDFSLVEQLHTNMKVLNDDDINDPHLFEILKQNISNDLPHVIETTNLTTPEKFIRSFSMNGGTVEARPLNVKAFINAAFFVPPLGAPKIIGTWETVFSSAYEPIASIHPAFSVKRDKLKKYTMKIAGQCSSMRLLGYNIVKYYYGTRIMQESSFDEENCYKTKLVADDLILSDIEGFLPELLAETATGKVFDEESMSIGPSVYTYVQPDVQLPEEVQIKQLKFDLQNNDLPIDTKLFIMPNLQNKSIIGMVVMESSIERLTSLVYKTFFTMIYSLFNLENDPGAKLFVYLRTISFLKSQFDDESELKSSAQMQKIKDIEIKPKPVKMFKFNVMTNGEQTGSKKEVKFDLNDNNQEKEDNEENEKLNK